MLTNGPSLGKIAHFESKMKTKKRNKDENKRHEVKRKIDISNFC